MSERQKGGGRSSDQTISKEWAGGKLTQEFRCIDRISDGTILKTRSSIGLLYARSVVTPHSNIGGVAFTYYPYSCTRKIYLLWIRKSTLNLRSPMSEQKVSAMRYGQLDSFADPTREFRNIDPILEQVLGKLNIYIFPPCAKFE